MEKQRYSILFTIIGFLHLSHGCSIEDVNWFVPVTRNILDTHRGNVFSASTQNIQGLGTLTQGEGLIGGPYVTASLDNSKLIIETNTAFETYENIEIETIIRYTLLIRCSDGSTRNLVFILNITDTNNNDPIFLPTNNYEFTIFPPVPPGFVITTCLNDILVRDIDLTTKRIDFEVEGSDLFAITFDPSSEVKKEFKAILNTTDLIRSLAEPIKLTVTATDVDSTSDPPRTATATVVITADNQYQFPDEPVFSQPFYLANYKSDNDVILQDTIFLREGYDNLVEFSFEGDHSKYFGIIINDNDISFNIKDPIPVALYDERQIYLIVKAERDHTSGASATVIVKLPEDTPLEFENAIYEGSITDNILELADLKLKQGYDGFNITVDIESEYAFTAKVESNVIKISMDPLATGVIQDNNFINLQVTASNNRTTAVAVVILEIIKDDYITPVFENNFYSGSYSTELGLTLEQIVITQGFDKTVNITLEGEHKNYFQIDQDGPRITLTSSTIPTDIFNERNIMISVLASKPRTVGAHAAVNIELPSARYLDFEKNVYEGTIENNNLILSNIVLTGGYASDVNFTLTGEFMAYFSIQINQSIVTIDIKKEIPEIILLENDIIVLTLDAIGTNAIPTSTSIVLQIIKEDLRTPVFSENLYSLKYEDDEVSLGNITLIQGYDETVIFGLTGDHREYFRIESNLNFVKLVLNSSIPEDIIFNEKTIVLNIVAQKPRTVGANAAVQITFPQEMIEPTVLNFSQNAYKGFIQGSNLTVDDIVLEAGYAPLTNFILSGEYSEYFSIQNSSNVVKLTPASDLSLEDLEVNTIILEVKATRDRAISATTIVVIEVLKTLIVPPVFEKAFYTGTYTSSNGLLFDELISLEKGFDSTVEFSLEEEFSEWFTLEKNESSVNLKVNATNPIPDEVLENNSHLFLTVIASKPGAISGRAVIYIDLPKEVFAPTILQFENRQYFGIIENNTLLLENIRLLDANISLVHFNLTGEFSEYFTISKLTDAIIIGHEELPMEVIENNNVLTLNIEASKVNAISGHATLVLEIIRNEEQIIVPIFEEAFYTGQYSNQTGLIFPSTIKLVQGFDETVTFGLMEEDAKWFSLNHNGPNDLSLRLKDEGLNEITGRSNLVFTVVANKTNSTPARSAVIISLKENNDLRVLQFEQKTYVGRIENQTLHLENLRLLEENITSIEFNITGDYASYFTISKYSDFIQINLLEPPSEMIEDKDFVILNLEASELGAISGHTTIVVKIIKDGESIITKPIFSEVYYTGEYSQESELIFPPSITLIQGYDETVSFELEDDDSQWFSLVQDVPNNLTLKIKNDSIIEIAGRSHLIFTVAAHKVNSTSAYAAIVISLANNSNVRILKFEQTSYLGHLENKTLELEEIRVLGGITSSMDFNITGDYASYFSISKLNDSVKVNLKEFSTELTDNNDLIILNLKVLEPGAVSGHTTILVNIVKNEENNIVTPVFSEAYYTGQYSNENGLVFLSVITLIEGYDETVTFSLDNDDSKGFALMEIGLNNYSLILNGSLSEVENKNYLLFTVIADKPNTNNGQAAIVISLTEPSEIDNVSFDRILYNGKLHNGVLSHDKITLSGFNGTNIQIIGEHKALFTSELTNGVVIVEASKTEFPINLTYIALELQAGNANAVLLIDVSFSDPSENENVSFDRVLYNGKLLDGVLTHDQIILSGFNGTNIQITGEHSALFRSELANGVVTVEAAGAEFPENLTYILLELQAASATAVLLIDVSFSDPSENEDVSFDRVLYNGKLLDGVLTHDQIILSGFNGTNIQITGEHSALFRSELANGVVTVEAAGVEFPENLNYILLELQAASANAVLLIDSFSDPSENEDVSFDQVLYYGRLLDGVLSHDNITLSGFNGTNIQITGEHNSLFRPELTNGVVKVESSGVEFPRNLTYILLELHAASANAVLLIDVSFSDPSENEDVSFDRVLYNGKLLDGVLSHDNITLSGFNGTNIQITGEHNSLFRSELTNGVVKIEASGVEFPKNLIYIALELQAASANAVLLIDVSFSDPSENEDVSFDRILYNGKLLDGVLSHDQIILSGFNGTNIQITGEHSALFRSELANGVVKVEAAGAEFPENLTYILLELQAASANAVLLIDVRFSDPSENEDVSFDRVLYNGKLLDGVLTHDQIILSGFNGTNIQITGEHNALFRSELSNGVVKVEASGAEFPRNITYIALELQAGNANAVLLIKVSFSENPDQPIVSFKSQSYYLWADVQQTGVVGVVEAAADNGEAIIYSLSGHIQNQIDINSNGEILLKSAFDKGVYTFTAVATSVQSQVQATAPVLLRVDTLPECSNEAGLSPLIILERLEEEPHRNLVVLNQTEHKGCRYTLSNVFPKDQSWLYVDNDGLHTKIIDREDRSIAFMTLSQIQVELTLDCDSDEVPAFAKRSLSTEDKSDLYSYDDGPNKWVLTDSILFNARRSFVNLIVKDINDNSPIFLGKGNEPIYVGYPVSELEGTVSPRALAELKATDADIGENAAIIYWSQENNLAVSPSTGLVHVRNNAELENNSRLTIYAIDQNGKGRNGTIDIVVKLLDKNQIIVLTVRDAFLEDEADVVNEISKAVGYEIKVLRAVVIPNNNEEVSRGKRDVASSTPATLQLYAYGLLESEPVDINQLTRDINNINIATVNIAKIISLEDHLTGLEIGPAPGRDMGLLAATIVLAVLLLIAIVAIAVRFFLRWKVSKNYKQFSDNSSSASQSSAPNLPKIEVVPKLRPNIDEIKRTERRLQEMLEQPIEKAPARQADNIAKPPTETLDDTLVNISPPDAQLPIVIQSIDKLKDKTEEEDNDEFGEVKKPRKSVVTFNENVEKIIHIEDVPDDNSSENSFKIYKL